MTAAPAFRDAWLGAPFAWPRDPRYVAAARRVRETRWAWFQACRADAQDYPAWRRNVDRTSAAHTAAIRACIEEDDRCLADLAAERAAQFEASVAAGRIRARGGR